MFQEFNSRAEEGDGAITSNQISWFMGFENIKVAGFKMAGILQWLIERL